MFQGGYVNELSLVMVGPRAVVERLAEVIGQMDFGSSILPQRLAGAVMNSAELLPGLMEQHFNDRCIKFCCIPLHKIVLADTTLHFRPRPVTRK
jgi:hypothetical protein